MSDDNFETLSTEDKLKVTLYHQVSKSLDEVGKTNQLLGEASFEPEAKELIAEFLWKKLVSYSQDLEAFALHAKRSTINVQDVKLLFRKNTQLLEKINAVEQEIKSTEETKPVRATKRKKTTKEPTAPIEISDDESNN